MADKSVLSDKRVLLVLGLVLFVAGATAWRLLTHEESEEDRIRRVLDEMEEGIQEKDVGDVLEHVAPDYKDKHGWERQAVKGFLVQLFIQKGAVRVFRPEGTEVEITEEGRAVARFRAVLQRGDTLDSLRDTADYHLEVELAKDADDAWKVKSHRRRSP